MTITLISLARLRITTQKTTLGCCESRYIKGEVPAWEHFLSCSGKIFEKTLIQSPEAMKLPDFSLTFPDYD